MFGKRKNNKENKEVLSKKANNNKYNLRTFTPKIRYDLALRFGIFVKEKEEVIRVKGIEHIEKLGCVKEIPAEKVTKFLANVPEKNEKDYMGKPISNNDIEYQNGKIKYYFQNNAVKIPIEEVNDFYENLAIIIQYMRIKNIDRNRRRNKKKIKERVKNLKQKYYDRKRQIVRANKVKLSNNNFIYDINNQIIKTNLLDGYNKLDADYYIRFFDAINNNYGGLLKEQTELSLMEQIGMSNNNEEILDFVMELEERFDTIKPDTMCDIIQLINNKVILTAKDEEYIPYLKEEKNGKQEIRNIKLNKIRDILSHTDIKHEQDKELVEVLNKMSRLTPRRLEEYWNNYSNEMSDLETANIRLDNYLDDKNKKRDNKKILKKPTIEKSQGKRNLKRKATIAACVGAGILALTGASTLKNNNRIQEEITKKLELPIEIDGKTLFYAGDEIRIIKDLNKDDDLALTLKSSDKKLCIDVTEEQLEYSNNLKRELGIEDNEEER